MDLAGVVERYGFPGAVALLALGACYKWVQAQAADLAATKLWIRETLVGLVKDCTVELEHVRAALETAPCRRNGAAAPAEVVKVGKP